MVVAEAERVLAGVRVPTEQDFDDNASDWLRAGDLETLAAELIGRYGELAQLGDLRIRYAWKREGGTGGKAGFCKKLGHEARYLSGGYEYFIWLAADDCRALAPRQMVERLNRQSGGSFLGCSRYPECQETRPVPVYVTLMRQGAAVLPGFEEVCGG